MFIKDKFDFDNKGKLLWHNPKLAFIWEQGFEDKIKIYTWFKDCSIDWDMGIIKTPTDTNRTWIVRKYLPLLNKHYNLKFQVNTHRG